MHTYHYTVYLHLYVRILLGLYYVVHIKPFGKVFTKIKRIRDHRHYVKFITIIVWSAAFGLTVPTLLHSKYDEDTYQCQQDWPGYDHRYEIRVRNSVQLRRGFIPLYLLTGCLFSAGQI